MSQTNVVATVANHDQDQDHMILDSYLRPRSLDPEDHKREWIKAAKDAMDECFIDACPCDIPRCVVKDGCACHKVKEALTRITQLEQELQRVKEMLARCWGDVDK